MSQLVLGLGNKARHGKDSFSEAIESYYLSQNDAARRHSLASYKSIKIQRLAFADALYREVNEWLTTSEGKRFLSGEKGLVVADSSHPAFPIIPDWVQREPNAEVSKRAPLGKHPKLLQWWGTEYRRSQNISYWTDRWKAAIDPTADIVMSTDMRFLNEAQAVKDVGGFAVQVNRLNVDGTPFVDPSRPSDHPSETQLDGYNFDFKITVKTGDLVLLQEWAVTLVHFLRGRAKKGK